MEASGQGGEPDMKLEVDLGNDEAVDRRESEERTKSSSSQEIVRRASLELPEAVHSSLLRKNRHLTQITHQQKPRFKLTDFSQKPLSLLQKAKHPLMLIEQTSKKHTKHASARRYPSLSKQSTINRSVATSHIHNTYDSSIKEVPTSDTRQRQALSMGRQRNHLNGKQGKTEVNVRSTSPETRSKLLLQSIKDPKGEVAKQLLVSYEDKSVTKNVYEKIMRQIRLDNKFYDYRLRNRSMLGEQPNAEVDEIKLPAKPLRRGGRTAINREMGSSESPNRFGGLSRKKSRQRQGRAIQRAIDFQIDEPFTTHTAQEKPRIKIQQTASNNQSPKLQSRVDLTHRKGGLLNLGQIFGNALPSILKNSRSSKDVELRTSDIMKQLDINSQDARESFLSRKMYLLEDVKRSLFEPASKSSHQKYKSFFSDCYNKIINKQDFAVLSSKELTSKKVILKHKSLWIDCDRLTPQKPVLVLDLDDTLVLTELSSRRLDNSSTQIILDNGNTVYVVSCVTSAGSPRGPS